MNHFLALLILFSQTLSFGFFIDEDGDRDPKQNPPRYSILVAEPDVSFGLSVIDGEYHFVAEVDNNINQNEIVFSLGTPFRNSSVTELNGLKTLILTMYFAESNEISPYVRNTIRVYTDTYTQDLNTYSYGVSLRPNLKNVPPGPYSTEQISPLGSALRTVARNGSLKDETGQTYKLSEIDSIAFAFYKPDGNFGLKVTDIDSLTNGNTVQILGQIPLQSVLNSPKSFLSKHTQKIVYFHKGKMTALANKFKRESGIPKPTGSEWIYYGNFRDYYASVYERDHVFKSKFTNKHMSIDENFGRPVTKNFKNFEPPYHSVDADHKHLFVLKPKFENLRLLTDLEVDQIAKSLFSQFSPENLTGGGNRFYYKTPQPKSFSSDDIFDLLHFLIEQTPLRIGNKLAKFILKLGHFHINIDGFPNGQKAIGYLINQNKNWTQVRINNIDEAREFIRRVDALSIYEAKLDKGLIVPMPQFKPLVRLNTPKAALSCQSYLN